MSENIVKIQFGDMGGTGIVIYSDKDKMAVIVTANHCLKNIGNNYKEIKIPHYSESRIIECFVDKEADLAFLVCKQFYAQEIVWSFQDQLDKYIPSAKVKGFPTNKESEIEEYEVELVDINYQSGQELYIGKLNEDIGEEKSILMNGMSGSPVYSQESKELYGMYLGSLEKDYNYNENRILPISIIIDLACRHDILYLKEGKKTGNFGLYNKRKYLNKPLINHLGSTNKNELNFLLLGKSGNGKSAFIKSFLKHKNLINSTGEGRTTRISCEYNIIYGDYIQNKKPCVTIKFYDKSAFAESRWGMLEGKIKALGDYCESEKMFHFLCYDEGFFSVEEFDTENQNEIGKIFDEIFQADENGKIKIQTCEDDELHDIRALVDRFNEKCFSFLKEKLDLKNKEIKLDDCKEDEVKFLDMCIREVEGKTYAGLVDKIEVYDRICDEYCQICEELNLSAILLVDTYGLDHTSDDDKERVNQRLSDLICAKYENIKNVLYIRKLNSDSPNDLEYYLPALYKIDPNVILNVIFTEIDKNDCIRELDKSKDLDLVKLAQEGCIQNKSVKYFIEKESHLKYKKQNELKKAIQDGVKSKSYADTIFEYILKYLTPYCAAEGEIYEEYLTNNCKKVKKLFQAIINEEYRGNGIISLKRCKENFKSGLKKKDSECYKIFKKLIMDMFKGAQINWNVSFYHRGHWKTKLANIKRIQRMELGYSGTHDDRWSSSFKQAYFACFSTMEDWQFQKLFGEVKETNSGISIQTILNSFVTKMIGCEKFSQDFFLTKEKHCTRCSVKDNCFKYKLINTYEENELNNENIETRESWLNARTNFSERFKKNEQYFMDYFVDTFMEIVFEFEKHNLTKIEKMVEKDTLDANLIKIKKDMQSLFKNEIEVEDEILSYVNKRYKELKLTE